MLSTIRSDLGKDIPPTRTIWVFQNIPLNRFFINIKIRQTMKNNDDKISEESYMDRLLRGRGGGKYSLYSRWCFLVREGMGEKLIIETQIRNNEGSTNSKLPELDTQPWIEPITFSTLSRCTMCYATDKGERIWYFD